jgi:hypothetical protein
MPSPDVGYDGSQPGVPLAQEDEAISMCIAIRPRADEWGCMEKQPSSGVDSCGLALEVAPSSMEGSSLLNSHPEGFESGSSVRAESKYLF